ncbi:hypothetical protein TSOC_003111 [Tetrabaena socialis]|uniref:Uncharacterized protein n=1 Tax=Tetrabaena socialis TaxID=47790 RepID=A0A2J8ACC7_9CHLO|nr:hypothetical protein TSOC_003111 [Tetrabaena socialis]|eukprot:PNH10170.1 hypothetical protein TSOC_003111 [Tetrabaena socialis]
MLAADATTCRSRLHVTNMDKLAPVCRPRNRSRICSNVAAAASAAAAAADDAAPPHVLKAVGLTYNDGASSTIHRQGTNAESAVCTRVKARIKVLFGELQTLGAFTQVNRVSGQSGGGQRMSGKACIPYDRLAIIPPCYAGVAKLPPAARSEVERRWAELSELVAAEVDHFVPSAGRAMRVFVL